MKFTILNHILCFLSVASAYTITEGFIKTGENSIHFGEVMTQEIKQLKVNSLKDKIEIKLKIKDSVEDFIKPQHLTITVSDPQNPNLISHFTPVLSVNREIKLSIPINSLPPVLKSKLVLQLGLIVARENNLKFNLNKHLSEILFSDEIVFASTYKRKESDIGPKPLIHHTFKTEEKHVSSIIPIIFIAAAITLFLALNLSWNSLVGTNNLYRSFKTITPKQLSYNALFLLAIAFFEYNIFNYYLGQSIFTTLFRGFVIGLPSVYLGSKVLRYLRAQRLAGRD